MSTRIAFLSDLHLFSERSVADQHQDEICSSAQSNDVFVLGGDIFDFQWSCFGTTDVAVDKAKQWLVNLIKLNNNCQFKFLLGNHDCFAPFVVALEQLQYQHNNFEFHPYFFHLADSIFLHGDVIDCQPSEANLQKHRALWAAQQPKPKWHNHGYNIAVATGIHRVVARRFNSVTRVSSKLLAYIEDVGINQNVVNRVYFGHTHWKDQFVADGITFRNGGAAIKGLAFEIIETEIQS